MVRLIAQFEPVIALASLLLFFASEATGVPIYSLTIVPDSLNIQTCGSATFRFGSNTDLSTFVAVPLAVSVESTDGKRNARLGQAALGDGTWVWQVVNVPAGEYRLSMSNTNPVEYSISGASDPFTVRLLDTSCFDGPGSGTSPTNTSSTPTPTPTPTPNPNPTNTNTNTYTNTADQSSSSSSNAENEVPTTISTASHSSAGLKAGVSVAAVAVVLAGAGALYWLLANRRRRSGRKPIRLGGKAGPGYDDLQSRDDYPTEPKPDPLGRSFSSGAPPGGAVGSYSRSDFLEEKSGLGTSVTHGASSNGATAGHGVEDSRVTLPNTYPIMTAGASSSSHENHLFNESTEFENGSSTNIIQAPKRAARKPVPAYMDTQIRHSEEKRHRDSGQSVASSTRDLPPQPSRSAPTEVRQLTHKGSFGDSKPMNHVLIPDLPLHHQND